ncbi:hypothetical protein ACQ4XT_03970 [Halobacillus faecis]
MKKFIVFLFALILSYGLVSWGTGLVLTFLQDPDPWMINGGEDPSILVKIMPAIMLILPILMAILITNIFGKAKGIRE